MSDKLRVGYPTVRKNKYALVLNGHAARKLLYGPSKYIAIVEEEDKVILVPLKVPQGTKIVLQVIRPNGGKGATRVHYNGNVLEVGKRYKAQFDLEGRMIINKGEEG